MQQAKKLVCWILTLIVFNLHVLRTWTLSATLSFFSWSSVLAKPGQVVLCWNLCWFPDSNTHFHGYDMIADTSSWATAGFMWVECYYSGDVRRSLYIEYMHLRIKSNSIILHQSICTSMEGVWHLLLGILAARGLGRHLLLGILAVRRLSRHLLLDMLTARSDGLSITFTAPFFDSFNNLVRTTGWKVLNILSINLDRLMERMEVILPQTCINHMFV